MVLIIFLTLFLSAHAYLDMTVPDYKHTFDQSLFEEVLDAELCHQQMNYLINNNTNLLLRFLDAGIRTPRGLLDGNLVDLGNYFQCLNINHEAPSTSSTIEGKYCMIDLPLNQELNLPSLPSLPNITWPDIPWPELDPSISRLSEDILQKVLQYERVRRSSQVMLGGGSLNRFAEDSPLSDVALMLALCIPKSCTTKQAINELINTTQLGLQYEDLYCRLPRDKQWVAADYVAVVIFPILLLLVIASTGYDVYQTVIIRNDPKRISKMCTSFSVYTNTRRLVTYTPVPGTVESIDGVRSFAMMWVIIGHTYVNQLSDHMANPMDVISWITSASSIWITMGPITVDTFFMLSGLLLVYTTAGKMTRSKLLKNIHLFYLNRLLRMFPMLAAYVLIQASILNRISDGPNWAVMADHTHRCRVYWWSTLLHVQNWVNPSSMCLGHSWYLAIDVQLYIISPLVLFWVLGKRKRVAWIALLFALLISLVGATVYNFIMEFQAGPVMPSGNLEGQENYLTKYYVNTLCRSSPFFIGMIYGYLLHLNRQQKILISAVQTAILWACAVILLGAVTYITYSYMQIDWDNQTMDSLINSFMRPSWALAVGWIVFACHHGSGGPINWVLSLQCFKLLGRLSYGMYIVHYPLIFVVNSSRIAPGFFSPNASLFKFLADFALAAIVAFLLTLLVDSPCSTLIKYFMGGGQRRPQAKTVTEESSPSNGTMNQGYVNEESKNVYL